MKFFNWMPPTTSLIVIVTDKCINWVITFMANLDRLTLIGMAHVDDYDRGNVSVEEEGEEFKL